MLKSSKFWWGTLAGVVLGAIVAPKIRSVFPSLPSYGNGR
jgi:hypothetical protein